MIREDRLVPPHVQYAVDLSTPPRVDGTIVQVNVTWFERRRDRPVACIGRLWDVQWPVPESAEEFLRRHTDGRHGPDRDGLWDGGRYRGSRDPAVKEAHLKVLQPMLAQYPAIPPDYDGWWRF